MKSFRIMAIDHSMDRQPVPVAEEVHRSELFNSHVFDKRAMLRYLSKEAYLAVKDAMEKGEKISREVADQVAAGMKNWAISKGATHYTHWFQPLRGLVAEKHDSFFTVLQDRDVLDKFTGDQLVQQEPDASSFPSGGLRSTFEARGYTAWDPTSPAFVYGTTLCIPTVFISYTGHALDYKAPLLRSIQALNEAGVKVVRFFDRNVKKVYATLGWEQEFFLVDSALFRARPDLVLAGKTVLGHSPARGQQMEDHYFGSIPERVLHFIRELEQECLRVGIPLKTRHNEVAPNQYEVAPVFEEVNLSVDHNTLLMDIMRKVARRHNFEVLLYEKPFEGINGSGKHNNWSLMTDTGVNLLSPGSTPMKNLQFLTFFINVIKAVNDNEELLRSSIASAGNDYRLGANEAPPAIISVFIGDQLTKVLEDIKNFKGGKLSPEEKTMMKLNIVGQVPEVLLDNTDRNRTSPFAFTGNKFEFRAVGSSANCAGPMFVLNTIVAHQLQQFYTEVEDLVKKKNMKRDVAIFNVLKSYIPKIERILYEKDNYSKAWEEEAKKRGLSNNKTTPAALKIQVKPQTVALFEKLGVLSKEEIHARYEVQLDHYSKQVEIEAKVLCDLTSNHVIPTAIRYQMQLVEIIRGLKDIFGASGYKKYAEEHMRELQEVSEKVNALSAQVEELRKLLEKAEAIEDFVEKADFYADTIRPMFDDIRQKADALEMLVDDEIWPLVKYREMLFTR